MPLRQKPLVPVGQATHLDFVRFLPALLHQSQALELWLVQVIIACGTEQRFENQVAGSRILGPSVPRFSS